MKIIDRKHIGPLLLLMSFAVIGSMAMMLAFSSFGGGTTMASAQQPSCLDGALGEALGIPSCADLTATAEAQGGNGGGDATCLDGGLGEALGLPSCMGLTATAEANMTATAQANAANTAQAQANMTATAVARPPRRR